MNDNIDSSIKYYLIQIFLSFMTQEFAIFRAIYTQINKPWILPPKMSQKKPSLHDTSTLWNEDGQWFILLTIFLSRPIVQVFFLGYL